MKALGALRRIDGIWGLVVVLVVVGVLVRPQFLSTGNLGPVFLATAPLILLAVGQSFVLFGGEIDLSVGSTVGFAAVVCGAFLDGNPNRIVPVALLALFAGAVIGAINGIVTNVLGVPSFIVTLGMLLVVRGLIYVWTGGAPQSDVPRELTRLLLGTQLVGFATGSLAIVVAVVIAAWYLSSRSPFGRRLMLTGSGPTASRLAGLPVVPTMVGAFVVNGVFAAAVGIYYVAWNGSVRGDQGSGLELVAIAAAVLGGVSLFGGRGRISGAVGGAIALGLIFNILVLAGFPLEAQNVGKGLIIIVATLVYERLRGYRRRRPSNHRARPPAGAIDATELKSHHPGKAIAFQRRNE